ncbi:MULTISPECIES: chemotaxis protein [Gammaproteobacteria]|uniref:Chemotaxis protein n=1 Tax=Vreelandella halophila TaxID=86177 RepID=A0A9X4YDM8_9GAMM|nr:MULTISPECIES: chemotaxis protein [Gammaproteobacteria]KAA8984574.1 chemotaxis protein [Halospina sp. K52047b]MYL27541.1 chemotaxis protein [Halomonas utahensis]MYL74667.1 chemotaxis protein [Halomonas sp. 22501_18_FS]
MVQASLASKTQSFGLVREEIEQTIGQAEQSLEQFQENRESEEDLQNCVDYLNQLRGIFSLVELKGGALLCQEAVVLANEVPVGATDDKNNLLTALSNALFTLRRYIEYYQRQQVDRPELLLPVVNEIREARRDTPYPDSWFFGAGLSVAPDFCGQRPVPPLATSDESEFEVHARRFRLMYQVGLLGLLRNQDPRTSCRLISRSAHGLARLCGEGAMQSFWCLVSMTADVLDEQQLPVERNRKRLFMRIEKQARDLVYSRSSVAQQSPSDALVRELVYILYRSGSSDPEVRSVLDNSGLGQPDITEAELIEHQRHLYGPGADVLRSFAAAINEELSELKDRLDIVERGIDPDTTELATIADSLERVGNSLLILDLHQLSSLARQEAGRLRDWEQKGALPSEGELYAVADAVLNIEEAAQHLASHGITADTDRLAHKVRRDEGSVYVQEALIVLSDEASSALTLAKQAITAFLESDFDKLHLANVPATLRSIEGGMQLLGNENAARVVARVTGAIENQLLNTQQPPESRILEALADAITSLEYYIEELGMNAAPNPELLRLAETSLQDVGL